MKKLIVALLLLAGSVNAGQFLETFAEVTDQARRKLNITTTGSPAYLTDSTAYQYIREGMLVVNPMVMFDKEVKSQVTTFRNNTYTLDTMIIGIISVEMSKNDTVKTLRYVPRGEWYEQYERSTAQSDNLYDKWPSFFDYSDDQLFLYPTPRLAGDTIKVYGWQKVGSIDTVSTLTMLPEAYRIAVLEYVVYAAGLSKSHPMTKLFYENFQRAVAVINSSFNRKGAVVAPTGK